MTYQGRKNMKIIPISMIGILILSVFGIVSVSSKYTISDNLPPNDPEITGPAKGKVGITYLFTIWTEDPEHQNVSFYIEWGDGTSTGWTPYFNSGQYVHYTHTWYKINEYPLRCKAKDIYNAESNWTYMDIPIAKNTALNFNFNQFERLIERFPNVFTILQFLLDLIHYQSLSYR